MGAAGIDVSIFKAHSTRGAAMSKAARFVDSRIILKTAGSRSESTFARFYNKPTASEDILTNVTGCSKKKDTTLVGHYLERI